MKQDFDQDQDDQDQEEALDLEITGAFLSDGDPACRDCIFQEDLFDRIEDPIEASSEYTDQQYCSYCGDRIAHQVLAENKRDRVCSSAIWLDNYEIMVTEDAHGFTVGDVLEVIYDDCDLPCEICTRQVGYEYAFAPNSGDCYCGHHFDPIRIDPSDRYDLTVLRIIAKLAKDGIEQERFDMVEAGMTLHGAWQHVSPMYDEIDRAYPLMIREWISTIL